jgi:hypothetical protein
MVNRFLTLIAAQDCPGGILGVCIGKDSSKPICKVKFADDTEFERCVTWLRKKFCEWSKLSEEQITVTRNDGAREVEIKG